MPANLKITVGVMSYIDRSYRQRMLRVQKRRPRLTISKQIARCIEVGMPALELEAGLKKNLPQPD